MSRKIAVLGVVGVLALIIVVGGFALSRGYLVHFAVNGTTISRDEYFRLVESNDITLHCAPHGALGWLYLYEVPCFDTQTAVDQYLSGTP